MCSSASVIYMRNCRMGSSRDRLAQTLSLRRFGLLATCLHSLFRVLSDVEASRTEARARMGNRAHRMVRHGHPRRVRGRNSTVHGDRRSCSDVHRTNRLVWLVRRAPIQVLSRVRDLCRIHHLGRLCLHRYSICSRKSGYSRRHCGIYTTLFHV